MDWWTFICNKIEINPWLVQYLLDIVWFFQIYCQLDGQPSITGTLIDINLHIKQLVKDISSFIENCIVKCSPSFFSQLIDNERFHFLDLDKLVFFNRLGYILEDI